MAQNHTEMLRIAASARCLVNDALRTKQLPPCVQYSEKGNNQILTFPQGTVTVYCTGLLQPENVMMRVKLALPRGRAEASFLLGEPGGILHPVNKFKDEGLYEAWVDLRYTRGLTTVYEHGCKPQRGQALFPEFLEAYL